jgi:hypothetical protein
MIFQFNRRVLNQRRAPPGRQSPRLWFQSEIIPDFIHFASHNALSNTCRSCTMTLIESLRRLTLRPWKEFFKVAEFNMPQRDILQQRISTNLIYYQVSGFPSFFQIC